MNSNVYVIISMSEPEIYYKHFFGRNSDRYLEIAQQVNQGKVIVFNFYAFILGIFWMLYRRMYLEASIFMVCVFGVGIVESILSEFYGIGLEKGTGRILFESLIWSTLFGCLSNYVYVQKANREIKKILKGSLSKGDKEHKIVKSGGVSLTAHIIMVFAIIILILLQMGGYFG